MVLVTGGAFQGKLDFVKENFEVSENMVYAKEAELEDLFRAGAVIGFQDWIARALREGRDPYEDADNLVKNNPDVIITLQELGCGVVPMEAFDRNWRETTGRIGCRLAREAEAVYRLVCGIAARIK